MLILHSPAARMTWNTGETAKAHFSHLAVHLVPGAIFAIRVPNKGTAVNKLQYEVEILHHLEGCKGCL